MRETRKPQKLGTARISPEGNGRPGEAVADVEDSEAAEASQGADGSGRWWMAAGGGGGRGSLNCVSQFSLFRRSQRVAWKCASVAE